MANIILQISRNAGRSWEDFDLVNEDDTLHLSDAKMLVSECSKTLRFRLATNNASTGWKDVVLMNSPFDVGLRCRIHLSSSQLVS